jgi:hypothetical protein
MTRRAPMHKLFNAKRVREVEQYLEEDRSSGNSIEGVYRCYHGSFKIDWLRYDALKYFNFCLYILGLVNLNVRRTDWEELVKNIKFAKKGTFARQILDELVKDELDWDSYYKQGKPIDTDPFVVRYCGYYYFFKTVLECLIRYAKERTGKENFFRMVEYWEGVAEYFLMDIGSDQGGKNERNEGKNNKKQYK